MTIRSFAPGALASTRQSDMFVSMRRELDSLQRQLATGQKADTFGGLGFERRTSLDARGKMSMLAGYQDVIQNGILRLNTMSPVIERLDTIGRDTRSDLQGSGFDIGGDGRGTAQNLAEQRLRESLDHLNSDLNGRYLFAGRSVDTPPVESYDRIMNGDPLTGKAGLRTLISERIQAEVGADGLGRLATSVVAPTSPATTPYKVQVTGNGPSFPFGFQITSASASGAAISPTFNAGPPDQASLDVNSVPADGDTVSVVLRDKDNVSYTIQLTAKSVLNASDSGVFQIGSDAATTAANLNAAVRTAIRDKASAVLNPRAATVAAQEFFSGSASQTPERVAVATPRLSLTDASASTMKLAESVPAGFTITSATTASANLVATSTPATVPPSVTLGLTGQPADGDKIVLTLTDGGGVAHAFELTARTTPSSDPNAFVIGSNAAATFSGPNGLKQTLNRLVGALGAGEATAMAASGARPTLIWYKGDDAGPSARDTAPVRVDTSQVVATGARANEAPIQSLMAQLGVLATATFTNTPVERARYENLTGRVRDNLSAPYGQPRIEEIATDLGAALATMQGAKERHQAATNMLQNTLDGVEQASTEETAATMLNLQTRLQASYQTTAMLSQLSLTKYL